MKNEFLPSPEFCDHFDVFAAAMEQEKVFTNCNVCGVVLRTKDEDEMGMCERCAANDPIPRNEKAWQHEAEHDDV